MEMKYEMIITSVFKCNRLFYGADRTIYEEMKKAEIVHPQKNEIDQYKLGMKIGIVSAHLHTALLEAQEQYKDDENFKDDINECLLYLYEPTIDNIDKCINKSHNILKRKEI